MALKDTFKSLFNYFEIEDTQEFEEVRAAAGTPQMRVASQPAPERPAAETRTTPSRSQAAPSYRSTTSMSGTRSQELPAGDGRATIDIKYPKRYEDAPEIVQLLVGNASVLIDFQFMSDPQARRCLDYLDGARSVLAGNLKKVSNTMWLLTPVNVTVNMEELRSTTHGLEAQEGQFDFDMRR